MSRPEGETSLNEKICNDMLLALQDCPVFMPQGDMVFTPSAMDYLRRHAFNVTVLAKAYLEAHR